MTVIKSTEQVKSAIDRIGNSIGLVPTMGALHDGHKSLIARSKEENEKTAISIFINPKQFNNTRDLLNYPKKLNQDLLIAKDLGVDIVWIPSIKEVYPSEYQTFVEVRSLSRPLEGVNRPGHFLGVSTIITKLLCVFLPQKAYFGRKDFQQFLVIKQLNKDLGFRTEIVACPIIRDKNGLALSSRNKLLSENAKKEATAIFKGFHSTALAWKKGKRDRNSLLSPLKQIIKNTKLNLEYLSLANPKTLEEIHSYDKISSILISLAVSIENIRLIDNLLLPDDLYEHNFFIDKKGL